MGAVVIGNISNNNNTAEIKFKLTDEQEKKFSSNLKIGILKQLHKKQLLTDAQLNLLITKQNQ